MNKIHLVDKCLILFMMVLLAQSTYSLFSLDATANNHIDVIVRTATASIFGYILSSNFIRQPDSSDKKQNLTTSQLKTLGSNASPPDSIRNQIGFIPSNSDHPLTSAEVNSSTDESESETSTEGRFQIMIATAIGLFCLINLILLRNAMQWNPSLANSNSAVATMVQFRDLVSSCVGFLIGCPTNRIANSSK